MPSSWDVEESPKNCFKIDVHSSIGYLSLAIPILNISIDLFAYLAWFQTDLVIKPCTRYHIRFTLGFKIQARTTAHGLYVVYCH